jgi:hypothetical protein
MPGKFPVSKKQARLIGMAAHSPAGTTKMDKSAAQKIIKDEGGKLGSTKSLPSKVKGKLK